MRIYRKTLLVGICSYLLYGCGQSKGQSTLKEAWNYYNWPAQMGEYNFRFADLPKSGEHAGQVWSGDYWASYLGGAAQRWQAPSGALSDTTSFSLLKDRAWKDTDLKMLSPAEKYDLYAAHYDFPLTREERRRTKALQAIEGTEDYKPDFTIPSWEGLCHGWAPATIMYAEPKPVVVKNADGLEIPFGSADIKALLSLLMAEGIGSNTSMLGTRCEADFAKLKLDLAAGRITTEAYDEQLESMECRDTNAGSFHVVLTNQLGLLRQGFVADVQRDYQVWNQGFVSYESTMGAVKRQKSPGAANKTVYEVKVMTDVRYIQEVQSSWEALGVQNGEIFANASYEYRLELNADKEIIGGAWISEERPDFLWIMTPLSGTKLLAKLPEIFQAATGDRLFPLVDPEF